MFIHIHSLVAGLIVLVLLLGLRLPALFGVVIIPICLWLEQHAIEDHFKRNEEPRLYAFTELIQSTCIACLFVVIRVFVFTSGW